MDYNKNEKQFQYYANRLRKVTFVNSKPNFIIEIVILMTYRLLKISKEKSFSIWRTKSKFSLFLRYLKFEFMFNLFILISDYTSEISDYGLPALSSRSDVGVGIKTLDNMHYHMEEVFSVESLNAFCKKFLAGGLVGKFKVIIHILPLIYWLSLTL